MKDETQKLVTSFLESSGVQSGYNPASKYQSGRHRQLVDVNRHTSASAIPRQADAGF